MTYVAIAFLIAVCVVFVGLAALPSVNTAISDVDTSGFNSLITVAVKAMPFLAVGFVFFCAWIAWRRG